MEFIETFNKFRQLKAFCLYDDSLVGDACLASSLSVAFKAVCEDGLEVVADDFVAKGLGGRDEASAFINGHVGIVDDAVLSVPEQFVEQFGLLFAGLEPVEGDDGEIGVVEASCKRRFAAGRDAAESEYRGVPERSRNTVFRVSCWSAGLSGRARRRRKVP